MTDAHSSPASPGGPPCVLIVEDATEIADLMDDIVRDLGYAVSGLASTIVAARLELAKRNFDAVLLDMGLDGQYSPEIADALFEMGVPFAFVTGYDEPFEARHANVPLLSKPFKSEQLRVLLENLIGPSQRDDEPARCGLTQPPTPTPISPRQDSRWGNRCPKNPMGNFGGGVA